MKLALIALSPQGAQLAARVARALGGADAFVHVTGNRGGEAAPERRAGRRPAVRTFSSILELTEKIFPEYRGLVYFAPCGVAVRALAPCVKHKLSDPAVVVVDVGGRYAISLLSGHEGGANALALRVANVLSAEPVVTTTTEALKTLIVGVGCRRGVRATHIVKALRSALKMAGAELANVRLLASADIKADEEGLLRAASMLGLPLRFISSEELRSTTKVFRRSKFVQEKVALPAVAEPAALLAGRRTQLILPKTIFKGITIAIARENCLWSASAPAENSTAPIAPRRRSPKARSSAVTQSTLNR
ncbi:MAG TPA: cobalamin biosynthesis protein [Planctomycetota bacterium]|jgi:cobalt-precorrin 5A hydrolase